MPSCDSRSCLVALRLNLIESLSLLLRSIGDQPATLPATIPAMTVAGPKAELERDLVRRRLLGVGGAGEPSSACMPLFGVPGSEWLDRDLVNISLGCWTLNLMALRRPPRTFLRKASSSRI